jgi:TM2 domain-containing membrane protein YozV
MNDVKTSYLLWMACFFGVAGLQRLYNRKILTGLLWLVTGGLFGVGQLLDLVLIPSMVDEHNARARERFGVSPYGIPLQPAVTTVVHDPNSAIPVPARPTREQMMLRLLQAAQTKGGKLSVSQAVLTTEYSFTEVQETLQEMVKMGYVAIENDPETGVVVYDFVEL